MCLLQCVTTNVSNQSMWNSSSNWKKKTPTECYKLLKEAYGEKSLSRGRVFEWCKWFSEVQESSEDDQRPWRLVSVSTPEKVNKISEIVHRDQHEHAWTCIWTHVLAFVWLLRLWKLIKKLSSILLSKFNNKIWLFSVLKKVCAKLVSKILTPDHACPSTDLFRFSWEVRWKAWIDGNKIYYLQDLAKLWERVS